MTLVHKDLLRSDRPVLAGEEAFRFRHLLIRDAAYQALAKADRAELHERFARWLTDHGAGLVELDEIVGYHLEQAHRYRTELGPVDDTARRLSADAAAHLGAAGRRALDRGDTGAAVNLLERAIALLPPQEVNLALQESLIRGLGESGRLDEAISRAERLPISAQRRETGWASCRRGSRERGGGKTSIRKAWFAELRALVEEARATIEQDGDPAARAELEYAAGDVDFCPMPKRSRAPDVHPRDAARRASGRPVARDQRPRDGGGMPSTMGPTPRTEALRWLIEAEAQSATYQPQLRS